MKLAHLTPNPDLSPRLAVIKGSHAVFAAELGCAAKTLQQLLESEPKAYADLQSAATSLQPGTGTKLSDLQYGPSVISPPVTLAVGLNYSEHANELSLDNDAGPVLFSLFPNSLAPHNGTVELPTHLTREVDYEGELGVIIGKEAKNLTPENALDHVFGYTVVNDLTARNLQFAEPQWSRCKSFDGFTPVGPVVVTADEIPDPQQLKITTEFDDLRVQDSSTSFMVRSVKQLLVTISQSLTLKPGTMISTGSPGGAGRSRKPPLYLKDGTVVTVTIEKIGALTTHAVEV
ncbi:fumarylacetoacetate hydrolase family protein [Canibacter sp. lx-45]|uniref:fumarylacetoacetate hydrolase family protein n=1 Tax=Canibacter zhuwentaonis TaxID=2837491 RepID=UPI001BDC8729|nr:fumarylacetoacetate hydrolase family protein [Canibacter zhuwentaonis]